MTSNGDEREARAWERVEAKLDRLGETVLTGFADTRARLDALEDRTLKLGAKIDLLGDKLDLDVRRLEMEIKRLRVELTNDAETFAKQESAGRADRLQEQVDELARRVEALETTGRDA